MKWKYKNIAIYGIGISGLSTVKALNNLGARLILIDSKTELELESVLEDIKEIDYEAFFGGKEFDLSKIDLLVKSPGIPLNTSLIKEVNRRGIEVITDLELAYRISKNKNMLVVTGTNGKTTTTSLLGKILEEAGKKTYVAGNIGVGIMDVIGDCKEDDILLVEASSFQLENTKYLKPRTSLLINISPDHLDWHGGFEEYFKAKKKAFINQDENDWSVLNYDHENIRMFSSDLKSKILFFSSKEELEYGVFIKDGKIYLRDEEETKYIMDTSESSLIEENLLAAIAVSYTYNIDMNLVKKVAKEFKPLEHRMEFVRQVSGVEFYNDSKGTNPESTINALRTIRGDKILIAGGYDKGSDYGDLIKEVLKDTSSLILMGETKDNIKKEALKQGYKSIYEVETMEEAVEKAYEVSDIDSKVILSPACASWGMYRDFKERGRDFKKYVENIRVN